MSSIIELTFSTTIDVTVGQTLTLYANDGTNFLEFPITFTASRTAPTQVAVINPYNENTQATEYKDGWFFDYQVGNEFSASVNNNVVTIVTNNDYVWTVPNGTAISTASVTSNIVAGTNDVTITNYVGTSGNECNEVDVTIEITGGTSPYDVYVGNILESSSVTSPHTLTIERPFNSITREVKVLDSGGDLVGIATTKPLSALTTSNINVSVIPNGANNNIIVNVDVISDVVSPYTYSLDNVTYQTNNTFTSVSGGSQTIYVKDAFGCVTSVLATLGYGLKYFFEFTDLENILHRVNIFKYDYGGASTEVNGRCTLEYPENDDIQSPIRASNLNLTLEASNSLTFSDLYSEEERTYKVEYIRNGNTLFNGFLSNDGIVESYVADRWILELNCIDGLGYLKDLAYVNDNTGLPFIGKQKGIEIIANCLKRTKNLQNIRTSIGINYTGLFFPSDVLNITYYSVSRFVNKEDEISDSEEVLKGILRLFNASIISLNGVWYVYRANLLADNTVFSFYEYDSEGTFIGYQIVDLSQDLGSQIDSFYPHHANANQQKTIKRSLGAYRVTLEYGRLLPFYTNTELFWDNEFTIVDWNINQSEFVQPAYPLQSIQVLNSSNSNPIITTDVYTVPSTGFIKTIPQLDFNFVISNPSEFIDSTFKAIITINNTAGNDKRYLNQTNGVWNTSENFVTLALEAGKSNYKLRVITEPTIYTDAELTIELYNDTSQYVLESFYVTAYRSEEDPKGRNFTIRKTSELSVNADTTKVETMFGDVPVNSFESAIFKNDQITQTDTWQRLGVQESKPLMQIMAEDRMRMAFNPRLVFSGDVYGYFPFFSILNINNINSKMFPISYSYDCYNNIISLKSLELINVDYNPITVTFSESDKLNQTIEPKLIGVRRASTVDPVVNPFVFTIQTTSLSETFTIPTDGTQTYLYDVTTSEETFSGVTGNRMLTFANPGTYDVEITGTFPKMFFNNTGDSLKIRQVKQWGIYGTSSTNQSNAFRGCSSLDVTATDVPDLSTSTSIDSMFSQCVSLINANSSIGNWDVSSVVNMSNCFASASLFNVDLSSWDVSNVTNMTAMFNNSVFNKNINSWDVSSVTTMASMFGNNSAFNKPLNSWDVSSVTDFSAMFFSATSFDQDISLWNIRSANNFQFFLLSSSLSTTNYDLLLVTWNSTLQTFVAGGGTAPTQLNNVNFGNSQYSLGSTAATARADLQNDFGWVIDDGGGI